MLIPQFLKAYVLSKRAGSLAFIIGTTSVVAVGLSVIALVIVISVMTGFGNGIRDRTLSVEPHLVVQAKDQATREQLVQELSKRPGITATIIESQDLIIRTVEGSYGGAEGRGVQALSMKEIFESLEREKTQKKRGQVPLEPRDFESETYTLAKGEVIIGVDLADSLAIFPGDEIVVTSPEAMLLPSGEIPRIERVRVKTVLRTNVPQIDSKLLFYGVEQTFRKLTYASQPVRSVEIRMKEPLNFLPLKTELIQRGHEVSSWVDRNSSLFLSLRLEKFLMTLFLTLTFLIGSFSIVTVLVLLANQKRNDIAMLRVMGLRARDVTRLFSGIGIGLSLVGLTVGLLMGVGIAWWIDVYQPIRLPDYYYDSRLPVAFDWSTIFFVTGLVFVVSVVTSWLTARQNTQVQIVPALRK
jgi:lipoprotein-releasing system permease protein